MFDTNVLISAVLFPTSVPGKALLTALDQGAVLASLELLHELRTVLARPRFDRYLTSGERAAFHAAFEREAEWIYLSTRVQACRDPKDDHLLSLAVSGRATHLISGDADLLALHPFRGIVVLSPQDCLQGEGSGISRDSTEPREDEPHGSRTEST